MNQPVTILGLCGSLRSGSYTKQAISIVLQHAAEAGAITTLLDADSIRLPLCDGGEPGPAAAELRQRISAADALVLATPEYCGTLSAALKNAIEWIGHDRLQQKVTGLVAVAAGSSADGSLNALRQLALCQGMWVIPAAAPVPLAERVFEQPRDSFSQLVKEHLRALGLALPEAVRRINQQAVTVPTGQSA